VYKKDDGMTLTTITYLFDVDDYYRPDKIQEKKE
jgi:hypothetical protein